MTRAIPTWRLRALNEDAKSAERAALPDVTVARVETAARGVHDVLAVVSVVHTDEHVQAWFTVDVLDGPCTIGPLGITWDDWLALPAIRVCG